MSDDERARLEAAGLVAPIVRGMDETTLRRRVHTYDRETGEPVREVTVRQLIGGLAKVTALEVEVVEGKRPATLPCERCGKPVPAKGTGPIPRTCRADGGCFRQATCGGGCGLPVPKHAFRRLNVEKRSGRPWMCQVCAQSSLDPAGIAKRAARARAIRAARCYNVPHGLPQKADPND